MRARLAALARELALLAFFFALALVHTGLWREPARRIGPASDSAHQVFSVNWAAREFLTAPHRVLEGNVFFPFHGSVAFFEPLLGPALLVAPFARFSDSPILVHNLAILLVLMATSYGGYRLGLRVLGQRGLAILAAIALPYSAQQTGHYGHLSILAVAGFPFLMLGLLRLKERPDLGALLLTGLAFGLQATTSGYQAVSAAALLAVGLAWCGRALLKPRTLLFALAAVVLGALIVLPWASTFLSLQQGGGLVRDIGQSRDAALTLRSYLASPSLVWRPVLGDDVDTAFPGLVVTVLGVLGFFVARGRHAWFLRIVCSTFFLLALGPDTELAGHRIPLPFGLAWQMVPPLRAARHPLTFVIPGLMALTFLAMLALTRWRATQRTVVLALLGVVVVAETFTPWELVTRDLGLPPVYERLAALPAGPFLELPAGGEYEVEWQWRAIAHRRPVVNGFAQFIPEMHRRLYRLTRREWGGRPARDLSNTRALEYLKRFFPIRYVLVHGDGWVSRSIARTPSFERVDPCEPEDCIYRLVRSGRGRRIERHFRDDQLRRGTLLLRVRGVPQGGVAVRFNNRMLALLEADPAERRHELAVPGDLVRRGLNAVVLEGATAFELIDIESGPS